MMYEEFEEKYRKSLENIKFPEILQKYIKCVCCLKESRDMCTLLVTDGNRKYILKIAEGNRRTSLEREKNIMEELEQDGISIFPSLVFFLKDKEKVYYMREYVEGDNLLTVVRKHGCMRSDILVKTAIQLCDLLEVLHLQKPPIIHSDIKPENIVCKDNRKFILIDFETARRLEPGKDHDSMRMGSRPTAAPEQFGEAGVDCRTDIYGLGMTLLYLACGSYDKKDLITSGLTLLGQRMIRKCLAYNPDKRYKDAAEFRKRLLEYERLLGFERKLRNRIALWRV